MRHMTGPGWARCLLGSLLLLSLGAHAQGGESPASTFQSEYHKRLKTYQVIEPLGESPFGERIDLVTGQVSFSQTDIVLEGTGPTLRVSRSRSPEIDDPSGNGPAQVLGDWTLEIPRISTLVAALKGAADGGSPGGNWRMSATDPTPRRCSAFNPVWAGSGNIALEEWWHGYDMTLADGSAQLLLKRDPAYTVKPTGGASYPIVTLGDVQVSCLSSLKNNYAGEGFLALAPDGTKYWFDWLVGVKASPVSKSAADLSAQSGEASPEQDAPAEPQPELMVPPNGDPYFEQERMQAAMYVTRIEDRFGNSLAYNYNPDNPRQLTSIVASDGRKVSFTWNGLLLVSATAQPDTPADARTWRYEYANGKLATVVLPDDSRWTYAMSRTGAGTLSDMFASSCLKRFNANTGASESEVSTITAPSGLVGTFTLQHRWHARSYAYSTCAIMPGNGSNYETNPPLFENLSLVQRTLSGPGLSTQAWAYTWGPAQASTNEDACAATQTCTETSWVDVTEPDNTRTRYTHSTRGDVMEGQLLKTDSFSASGALLRSETLGYPPLTSLPYPVHLGEALGRWRSNVQKLETRYMSTARVITQQGREFYWYVHPTCGAQGDKVCVDAFGRPTKTVQTTKPAPYARTDVHAYEYNYDAWVLGQPKKTTNLDTGLSESETVYDPTTALPLQVKRFGKLQQTLTYNADGTLATSSDGRDSPTFDTTVGFSNWKRGLPQRIDYPTGHYVSMWIDHYGLIRTVREENGHITCNSFDAMGRLTRIEYPSETQDSVCDGSAWANTIRSFQQTNVVEFGLGAGHWREFVQTGRGVKAVYYDALWRPVLTRTYDLDDANALSQSVTRYDHAGQAVFQSYPTRATISDFQQSMPGTRTTYDALGRPTRVEQDAEADVGNMLVSTTEYLDNFTTRTTNPRGKATVTQYMTYDQPTTEWPVSIAHPTGVYTDIARDTFGKPTILARSDASVSAVRTYAYNAAQELCRSVEPETGATLYGYDPAGNLAWSAAGIAGNPACDSEGDTPDILPRKVSRDYDQRNRIASLAFKDGRGDTTYTYTPDGLQDVLTVNNGGGNVVSTTYQYNRRRLLANEQMNWNAIAWGVGYAYNANGHLASQTYPGSLTVDYAPNALGQATKAGTYATGVTYHPNGAIAGFTYGNGIAHSLTQNARQLPLRSRDAFGSTSIPLDHTYSYDENGNVDAIVDGTDTTRNRAMAYDSLDRLTWMSSIGMLGGSGSIYYGYDGLDNIVSVSAPSRSQRYCYDANNRLTFLRAGATIPCSGGAAMVAFEYDEQGNVEVKNDVRYDFDFGNRLRSTSGGVVSTYVYDALGRRVRDVTTGSKYSVYTQGGQLAYASDLRAGKGYNYIYLGGSLVAERSFPTGTTNYTVEYQHTDALGTPVATSTATKQIAKSDYEPYGKVLNRAVQDGPGFTGHVEDAATGLTYMQQRYYDAFVGRFLSVDPVTANEIGDMRFFNRYIYAFGNPYKFVDQDGRCPVCIAPLIAGAFLYFTSGPANAPAPGERTGNMPAGEQVTSAFPGGGPVISGGKFAIRQAGKLSQRAASREARRQSGIPTSQQPATQTNGRAPDGTPVGRQQTYETPKPGGGIETKSVQVSRDTRGEHAGQPQIEAGTVKPTGQLDVAGRPRIQNEGKVRVDFESER